MANNGKKYFEVSADTRAMIDFLHEREEATYEEMSKLLGRDVQGKARYVFLSANRILTRDHGIVFAAVRNVGVKRLKDDEKVNKAEGSMQSIRRMTLRARRVLGASEYGSLSAEDKVRHNAISSVMGAIYALSRKDSQKRLESAVAESQKALPLGRTMELFIKG